MWLRSDGRECNAGMTIAKCTKTAASSNDSIHLSRTPAAWFASGTTHHGRPYRNLGSYLPLRSYTIVDVSVARQNRGPRTSSTAAHYIDRHPKPPTKEEDEEDASFVLSELSLQAEL